MSTEIIPFERHINAIAPLGLPAGHRISLAHTSGRYSEHVQIILLVDRNGYEESVASITVSYATDSKVSFENRLAKLREESVKLFNNYVTTLRDNNILKSIEDRLNAGREMLVLTASPVAHEDR